MKNALLQWILLKMRLIGFGIKKLGHASMFLLSKLCKKNLVRDLLEINFEKDRICQACQFGKQVKTSFKPKWFIITSRPLELLHMDLFGPTRTSSLEGKRYGLVIVDDFSRFTWIFFLAQKDESFSIFIKFYRKVSNEKGVSVICIRSDHGTEFEKSRFQKLLQWKRHRT